MKKAEEKGVKLLLPIDTVVAADFPNPIDAPVDVETVDVTAIPADKEGLDIGEKTRALFADAIKNAKTVVWNGPMGVFENPTLAKGTIAGFRRCDHRRRRRLCGGLRAAGLCGQDHAYFHRRRCFPRVPRGAGAARYCLPAGQVRLGTLELPASIYSLDGHASTPHRLLSYGFLPKEPAIVGDG